MVRPLTSFSCSRRPDAKRRRENAGGYGIKHTDGDLRKIMDQRVGMGLDYLGPLNLSRFPAPSGPNHDHYLGTASSWHGGHDAILSPIAQCLLGRTPALGRRDARLPPGEHPAALCGGPDGGAHPASAGDSSWPPKMALFGQPNSKVWAYFRRCSRFPAFDQSAGAGCPAG